MALNTTGSAWATLAIIGFPNSTIVTTVFMGRPTMSATMVSVVSTAGSVITDCSVFGVGVSISV